jgi:[ribosomal protein S18]-alanine N-acetyltransferase
MTLPAAITFRPVTLADAALLAALHDMSFGPASWGRESMLSTLAQPTTRGLLAVFGNIEPVGFILWQQAVESADVLTLAVSPHVRRHGVGRQLMDGMIADLREKGGLRILLEVADSNTPALRLYERCGFVQIDRRQGYYRTSKGAEDAFLMLYSIPQN